MSSEGSLPLFPLHTTLLPGAAIGLRVFEPRYLDLVRETGRSGEGFGVCLILEGNEVGAPATPAAFGVQVKIEDFDVGADGVLQLLSGMYAFEFARTAAGWKTKYLRFSSFDTVSPMFEQNIKG